MRALATAALAALLLAAGPRPVAAAPSDDDCLECHAEVDVTMERGGKTISLHVDAAALRRSAHGSLRCVQCHVGFDPDETPHKAHITPVACLSCHTNAPAKHSFHAPMVEAVAKRGDNAACKQCHGTHDVQRVGGEAGAALDTTNLAASCGRCHGEEVTHFEASAHGQALAAKQPGAPTCITCHQKPITIPKTGASHADSVSIKIEQEKLCLSCHLDDPAVRARMAPTVGFIAAYEHSVHGAALQAGNAQAANCVDCHGSHVMAKGLDPRSRANKAHIPQTCGTCHKEIEARYEASVHATALAKGATDAPVCTDCHGEHTIQKANAPTSPVAPGNVSQQVCSPCHSSVRLAAKYGIRSDRFKTFSDSFHGLAIRGGSISAANCASCHGAHDILPSSDPRSSIYPTNLKYTCGKCHPGATSAFANGKVHVEMTEADEPLLYWIALVYTILIVGTIGGMFFHNVLDFVRKARHRLAVRRGEEAAPPAPHGRGLFVRMTTSERLQHLALLTSFIVLVLTGFALRYPQGWLYEPMRRYANAMFEARGVAHRVAGVVLVLASLYHIYYVAWTRRGREFMRDIMLRPSDLKDATAAMRYYLGRTKERPRFGRFSYVEKSEYWALVWGTIVMAVTGTIMWFQDPFIDLLTKLGWDVARTVHVYEAVLATLAIIVWHFYFVIFNPDVYPMNSAWITGTLSEEEMEEEHPLELEAIRRKRAEEEARERAEAAKGKRGGADGSPPGGTT
ncbi:MAG: cytochrome b/b6 domain-containing protein [Hyphomicrobiales bacterium]